MQSSALGQLGGNGELLGTGEHVDLRFCSQNLLTLSQIVRRTSVEFLIV